MAIGIYDIFLK